MSSYTIANLRKALREAIQVELGTIPLYLSAYYSIDAGPSANVTAQREGARARVAILGIAIQEMLHLCLAGNILRSIDENPRLYDKSFIPTYPNTILKTKIEMNLRRADKRSLQAFLLIEAPYFPPKEQDKQLPDILPDSDSIGIHYEKIRRMIDKLEPIDSTTAEYQFSGSEFFGNSMRVIKDEKDADGAIDLITEQGEGGISVPDSHYSVFVDFYQRQLEWKLLPVKENPKPGDYGSDTFLRHLSNAFDATYCYILLTIDVFWTVSRASDNAKRLILARNIHPLMSDIMTPIADIMVHEVYNSTSMENASPCFAYYSAKSDGSPHTLPELHQEIDRNLKIALQKTGGSTKASIERVVQALKNIREP
ncbi:hypothetical protein AX15_002874 [Amanita polypyramis BW_CC]|nr:hypothetical protein AX15_002874 [Amanita polypyramis BW_CC]